jgi:hypothetical protein
MNTIDDCNCCPKWLKVDMNTGGAAMNTIPNAALITLLTATLDKGARFRFRAGGPSMSPFVKSGDVITVRRLEPKKLHIGDVLAFTHPVTDHLTVHRLIGKQGRLHTLKGDNIHLADNGVPAANILGVVTRVQRNGKTVRMGTGLGKRLIAGLSRRGVLIPAIGFLRILLRRTGKGNTK